MEMHDDFESLLRNAGNNYGSEALPEQTVSKMIDARLAESNKNLRNSLIKELAVIIIALLGIIKLITETHKLPVLVALSGGVIYLSGSIILFVRLMRVAKLQKDTGIKEYLKAVYSKTKQALKTYLWISTAACTIAAGAGLTGYGLRLLAFGTICTGMILYQLNNWYINWRFGKQLNEIETLMNEFE